MKQKHPKNEYPKTISTDTESLLFAIELGDSPTIDLHGMDAHSATIDLDHAINLEYAHGAEGIRIIHGMGSGTLRDAVHRFLKSHKLISAYRDAQHHNQQGGLTVAAFKK